MLIDALSTISPRETHNLLDTEQLSARWRSDTSDRRLLVILDDIVEAAQVWPLMPNSHRSIVIITSRQVVSGVDPDILIELGGLSYEEARSMIMDITRRASRAVDESVVAALARTHQLPLSIRHVADQLITISSVGGHVPSLEPGDSGDPIEIFKVTIRSLSDTERLVFGRAGLYPGAHATAETVGALAGLAPAEADAALTALHQHGLIGKPDPHGYAFHDLVRALALEQSRVHDGTAEQTAAHERLFRQTIDTLAELDALIAAPEVTDVFRRHADGHDAEAEFRAFERFGTYFEDFRAVARLAIAHEWPAAWQLTSGLAYFMRIHRNIPQAIELNELALQIALTAGAELGAAVCYSDLGVLQRSMSNYAAAEDYINRALPIFKARGDRLGQARCYGELGHINHHLTRYADARENITRALALYRQIDLVRGVANSEGALGMVNRLLGDYEAAREHLRCALDIYNEIENVRNQAWILIELGTIDRQTGNYQSARDRFVTAHDLFERTGDRSGCAWADRELGIVDRMTANYADAERLLNQALDVFAAIGSKRNIADAHVELGALHRETGALEAACRETAEALGIYQEIGNVRGTAWTQLQLGSIERLQGKAHVAERIRRALDMYELIGDRSGLARAHLELGMLAVEDSPGEARHHLTIALTLYEGCVFLTSTNIS